MNFTGCLRLLGKEKGKMGKSEDLSGKLLPNNLCIFKSAIKMHISSGTKSTNLYNQCDTWFIQS